MGRRVVPHSWAPSTDDTVLGRGTFSTVYLVNTVSSDIAVKVFHRSDKWTTFRVEREVLRYLQRTPHHGRKHVIRTIDEGMVPTKCHPYLVIDVYDMSLARATTNNPMPACVLKWVARQLLLALAACHAANVVHNDVKPDNILISLANKHIVLADFGNALWQRDSDDEMDWPLSWTTPWYRPPEAFLYDSTMLLPTSTDVWSYGCVLVELATNTPLVNGDTLDDLFHKLSTLFCMSTHTQDWTRLRRRIASVADHALLLDLLRGALTWERNLRQSVPELLQYAYVESTAVDAKCVTGPCVPPPLKKARPSSC